MVRERSGISTVCFCFPGGTGAIGLDRWPQCGRIEQRWTNADLNRTSTLVKDLVATRPDVILTSTTPVTAALKRESSTVPIVFTIVSDPVGAGFVASLPHPGGNITGFSHTDAGMGGKWLSLLKEIAPGIKRAGIMFNPDTAPGGGKFFLDSFMAGAKALAVEPVALPVRSDAAIETAITGLAHQQSRSCRDGRLLYSSPASYNHFPRRFATTCRRSPLCQDLLGAAV
jgi:hypothetical protein